MHKIKVLLADDHNLVRNGIKSLLESQEEILIVGEASNGSEALAKTKELAPDVLLLDIAMPEVNGLEVAAQLSQLSVPCKCLILSMHHNEDYILKAVESGAYGYLLKDTTREEMVKAIQTVAHGDKYFSPSVSQVIVASYLQKVQEPPTLSPKKSKLSKKEKVVLKFIVNGFNSREIAEKLEVSIRTVDNQRSSMMKRLGVKNAVELVKRALDDKLV